MTTTWYPLDREELRVLFDALATSMDFGSGFLDSDEVLVLRKLAVALDLDPMEGTPTDDRRRIVHAFKLRPGSDTQPTGLLRDGPPRPRCYWCGGNEAEPIHGGDA